MSRYMKNKITYTIGYDAAAINVLAFVALKDGWYIRRTYIFASIRIKGYAARKSVETDFYVKYNLSYFKLAYVNFNYFDHWRLCMIILGHMSHSWIFCWNNAIHLSLFLLISDLLETRPSFGVHSYGACENDIVAMLMMCFLTFRKTFKKVFAHLVSATRLYYGKYGSTLKWAKYILRKKSLVMLFNEHLSNCSPV